MNGPWPQIVNEKFFWCSATWKDVLRSLLQLRNPIFGVKSCMDCWNRKWYVRDTKVQVREFLNGMHCTETGEGNRAKKAASNVLLPDAAKWPTAWADRINIKLAFISAALSRPKIALQLRIYRPTARYVDGGSKAPTPECSCVRSDGRGWLKGVG